MKTLIAAIFCVAGINGAALWGADMRLQFEQLKSEARAAFQSEDWAMAEVRYQRLLKMADMVRPSAYEMYAEVVSPLAEIYKHTENAEKLEKLYEMRVERSGGGLEKGLAQADLGFYYQASEFASADRYHGENFVEQAMKTFEQCSSHKIEGEHCRRRLADTAGIQAAMFFQQLDYKRAEPLFRRVITTPEALVHEEVMLVSLHALRGILILRQDYEEAKKLEIRTAAFEAAHPNALTRLKAEGTRGRSR